MASQVFNAEEETVVKSIYLAMRAQTPLAGLSIRDHETYQGEDRPELSAVVLAQVQANKLYDYFWDCLATRTYGD